MARTCSRCGEAGHDMRTCSEPTGHGVLMAVNLDEGYGQWLPNCTECDWSGSWHTDRDVAMREGDTHIDDTRG